MMILHNTRFLASAAIAALAIGSTPLLAQVAPAPITVEPAPVPVFPETTAPAPPAQPAIVLPDLEAAPPPAAVTAPEPATTTTRTARAASPAAAPAPEPRVRAAAPVADDPVVAADEPTGIIAPQAAAEPVTPIAAAEPQPAAEPVAPADNTIFWVAAFAGLAAIVLAIWGFFAIGRRKPIHRKAAAIVERPVVMPRVPPEPEALAPAAAVTPLATVRPAEPSLSHTGASVPLPSKAPETFAGRDALIRRMIAARPDRANPFTSPIQRRKRAKLILQSLGRDFSDRAPWIDLSQYPQNWPELARRKQAAA